MRWWRSSALPAACSASPSICPRLRPMARQRTRPPPPPPPPAPPPPGRGPRDPARTGARALEPVPRGATALETAPNGAVSPPAQSVTLEDCEKVTRQLQFALEVDGVQYQRLEVASPGIDRPLRGEQDLLRFAGSVIDITLKAPIGGAAAGKVGAARKKFRGTLE